MISLLVLVLAVLLSICSVTGVCVPYSFFSKNDFRPSYLHFPIAFCFCLQGTVDFYQDWNNYSKGFGNLGGKFWLGLEKIHRLTKNENVTMRIDMEDFNGGSLYAEYNSFVVGSAWENFTLWGLSKVHMHRVDLFYCNLSS